MIRSTRSAALGAALFVIFLAQPPLSAQQFAARSETAVVEAAAPERLDMLVGRSAIVRLDRPITRVSLSTSDIADALVTSPYELLIHGKAPGTISLFVWADNGRIKTYDVAVRRDLSALDEQVHRLFPGEPITVSSNGKDVVLSGIVSAKYIADRASSLAVGYVDKPENVVNLLRQREGVASDQVMLQVRFAEVSRNAIQELGSSFFTGANGHGDWIGRTTTEQFAAPVFDKSQGLVFSDFLNLFLFNSKEQIGTLIKALSSRGLFQSLAEPNLITQDGKEASFLAGGEFPYPVVQSQGGGSSVTIMFKEFGIRLRFTPTILDGFIHLKIAPEVSTLDFTNAVTLQGFRVPALSTRRTETEVELRDGQTFAVAGLIDNTVNETMSRMPGIGDIPVLGYLFRSRAYQKNTTELVVMITPRIVRRDSPGVTPDLPAPLEPFLPAPARRAPVPPPAFSGAQSPVVAAPAQVPVALAPAVVPIVPAAAAGPSIAAAARPFIAAQASPVVNAKPVVDPEAEKRAQKAQLDAQEKARALDQKRAVDEQRAAEVAKKKDEQAAKAYAAIATRAAAEKAKTDRVEAERARVDEAQRVAADQKEAAHAREVADKLAKEEARKKAEQAKLDKEQQEQEQKLAERRKAAEARLAQEQARRDEALLKSLTH
jgi:pilus assembly protein CpaC